MYFSRRHLCPGILRDVENSDSCGCETIKALMGNGCLYVAKADIDDKESTDSEKDVSSCIELTNSQIEGYVADEIG